MLNLPFSDNMLLEFFCHPFSYGALVWRACLEGGRSRTSCGTRFADGRSLQRLLHSDFLRELLKRILSLQLFKLCRGVLVQELVNRQETSTYPNVYSIFIDANNDAFGTKLVDPLRLTHEHNLQLLAIWVVVDVLRQALVHCIVLNGNVHCDARFQIDNVLLQCFNLVQQFFVLKFCLLQSLQQFK